MQLSQLVVCEEVSPGQVFLLCSLRGKWDGGGGQLLIHLSETMLSEVAPPSKLSHGADNYKHKKIGSRLVERPYLGGYCTEHGIRVPPYVNGMCQHEVLDVVNPSPLPDWWFLGCIL